MAAPENKKGRSTEVGGPINTKTAGWLLLIASTILAVYLLFFGPWRAKESAAPPPKPVTTYSRSERMCTQLETVEGEAKIGEDENRCYAVRLEPGATSRPIIFPVKGETWDTKFSTPGCVDYLMKEFARQPNESKRERARCKTADGETRFVQKRDVEVLRLRNPDSVPVSVYVCIYCN